MRRKVLKMKINGKDYAIQPFADLSDLDLEGKDLTGADLRWSVLNGANLMKCVLRGANFYGSTALNANFIRADLSYSDLRMGWFDASNFGGADLRGARLEGVHFGLASLCESNLDGATFAPGWKIVGKAKCAKCGDRDTWARYALPSEISSQRCPDNQEHLRCGCFNCGHLWE